MSEDTQNGGNPFIGDNEGEDNAVREALIFTLLEAVFTFLKSVMPTVKKDSAAMRRVNGYKANQTVKATRMNRMAKMLNIRAKTMTAGHFVTLGITRMRFVTEGRPTIIETVKHMHFLKQAVEGSQAVRRALAAIASFDQWEASGAKAREEQRQAMQAFTGQEVEEVPEGMTFADEQAINAFNLKAGDFVRHVVIEQAAYLRASFVALFDKLAKAGVSFIDNSGDRQRAVERETYAEDSHLTVNAHTLLDWFKASVFTTARYCGACKKAGEKSFNWGVQQVKAAGGCPQCGTPAYALGKNSNTAHLPLLTPSGGLATVGGWRVEMKSFILSKRAFTALDRAALGIITVEDALRILMAETVKTRVQMDGRTVKVTARLVPTLFEIQTAGSFKDCFGLALEVVKQG
jgi:NACalpha-BTF3-like transcription factor